MENMKINWKLLQKAKNPRSQQEIGCREIENILKTAEKSWNFRWKLQNRTAGESKPSPNHPTKKSNRLKTVGHLYKMRFKNDTSILLFLHDTTKKKPMTSFLSWAYGGKKGIRTLEGFRGPTRFPVVRLRPAQPSFHIQLRVSQERFNIISVQRINVKAFLQFFSKKYKFKKSQVLHLQNTFVRDKTYWE